MLWLFGVILPIVALGIELKSGMSADIYFDPLPTAVHVALVGFVPVSVGLGLWLLSKRDVEQLDWVQPVLAFSMGIAGLYALLFLPLSPMGLIGIIFFGIGLLPLAPVCAFIATVVLWRRASRLRLSETADLSGQGKRLLAGLLAAAAVLVALELPSTLGQIGGHVAASDSEFVQRAGVDLLRSIGAEDARASVCTGRTVFYPGLISPMLVLTNPADAYERGKAYYRATGQRCFEGRQGDQIPAEPSGYAPVSLVDSNFDGRYHTGQAAAELDWTFVVDNASGRQQEARMLVQVPHGAVVSEVTLWMQGKPEKAEVDERGKVTRAYERTVAKARDPILVRSAGPDRIEVRCFPVPPGGEMRAKISFVVPAGERDGSSPKLRLPSIIARDF
jgi:hypothetical protein